MHFLSTTSHLAPRVTLQDPEAQCTFPVNHPVFGAIVLLACPNKAQRHFRQDH